MLSAEILLAGAILLTVILCLQLYSRLARKNREYSIVIEQLQADFSALCKSAKGVDNHLGRVDKNIERIIERQSNYDMSNSLNREYGHAIKSIRNGAGLDDIVSIYGLNPAEAKLLFSIHSSTNDEERSSRKKIKASVHF